MSRVSSAGCRHVALEHRKDPGGERSNPLWGKLNMAAGRDLHIEYKAMNALHDGREYVLPPHAKLPTILEAIQAVRARRMTFGAADNEFQHLSTRAVAAAALDQFPGFENWFKHQSAPLCAGASASESLMILSHGSGLRLALSTDSSIHVRGCLPAGSSRVRCVTT